LETALEPRGRSHGELANSGLVHFDRQVAEPSALFATVTD